MAKRIVLVVVLQTPDGRANSGLFEFYMPSDERDISEKETKGLNEAN